MRGKITAFLDCVSPYSYFAFEYLQKNRQALSLYDVDIEFIPVFLGGINVGSGNKPPWTLPAKAKYSEFDSRRAKKFFNTPDVKTPSFFPILSLLPLRAMVFVKDRHPADKYEASFRQLWVSMWEQQQDMSKPELLGKALREHFSATEVEEILEATKKPEVKQKLNDNTQKALDYGAFGAPWFWVKNSKGEEEPFFGSDRFHFMWDYLGVPCNHLAIKETSKL